LITGKRFAQSIALALSLAAVATVAAADSPQQWTGRWIGVANDSSGQFHGVSGIDIEIRTGDAGLELKDHDRQRGNTVPAAMTVHERKFSASYHGLWPTPIEASGTLAADGNTIDLEISGDGMTGLDTHHVTLRREDARPLRGDLRVHAFLAPRVDADARRVLDYRYVAPASRRDGLPVSNAAAVGIDPARLEAMVRSILTETGHREDPQTESVLILRHGKLVFEEYFWGQSADNPHIISSCTKSVTSIIAGVAADHDRLKVDAPVVSYVSHPEDTRWGREAYPITIRNILAMSSGTVWDDRVAGKDNPSAQLLLQTDVVHYVMGKEAVHPPGTFYNYDNGLPTLVGVIVARAMGKTYDQLADEVLFTPLGITNYRWTRLHDGSPLAAGGFYMQSRDMAKIGQLMLNGGRWDGKQVLSAAWVRESTSQQTASGQYPYGYYWHLTNSQHRHVNGADGFMALGQGGQIIAVFPSLDMVVVTTSQNWQGSGLQAMPFHMFDDYILPSVKDNR
jgi:CubicO group peptidase (beta-lactamase class C family)